MRTNSITVICGTLIALAIGTSNVWAGKPTSVSQMPLTEVGQKLETRYADPRMAAASLFLQLVCD